MPTRFQQRRSKGWTKPSSGRCVSRPSRFGNPFRVPAIRLGDPDAHALAVDRYRGWITSPKQAALLADARRELRGVDLGCYCAIGLPCHADVLIELVNT
jgi:Domain of unknown function (DUF4326)